MRETKAWSCPPKLFGALCGGTSHCSIADRQNHSVAVESGRCIFLDALAANVRALRDSPTDRRLQTARCEHRPTVRRLSGISGGPPSGSPRLLARFEGPRVWYSNEDISARAGEFLTEESQLWMFLSNASTIPKMQESLWILPKSAWPDRNL